MLLLYLERRGLENSVLYLCTMISLISESLAWAYLLRYNIRPDILSWNALFEVKRKELQKERTRPFHFRFTPETQRRYTLVVKQLLAYVMR